LIPLLQEKGFAAQTAVWLAALVGPMQVLGRLVELTVGRRIAVNQVALIALALLPASLIALFFVSSAWQLGLVFAVLYGASNGVMTIVRATIPAELFGRAHYGAVNGSLAAFVIVARASGPLAASLLWTAWGNYDGVVLVLAGTASLAVLLFYWAIRTHSSPAKMPSF
jgi:predicted MFS family arabinose efflux permease